MSENNSDIAIANMKRTSRRDDKNTVIDWKVSSYKNEDALARLHVENFLKEVCLQVLNSPMENSLKISLQSIKQF